MLARTLTHTDKREDEVEKIAADRTNEIRKAFSPENERREFQD